MDQNKCNKCIPSIRYVLVDIDGLIDTRCPKIGENCNLCIDIDDKKIYNKFNNALKAGPCINDQERLT